MEKDFNQNKDKVVKHLFDCVIEVDISVPDVVKGNFEEKLNVA